MGSVASEVSLNTCIHHQAEAGQQTGSQREFVLTVVTPAFNEVANLPVLYRRLCAVLDGMNVKWEWLIIDDHSRDDTFALIGAIASADPRVRGIRLARNFGSHMALSCGFHQATGDCTVMIAADLQDPPEFIPNLIARWLEGSQVVWAVRRRREGESRLTVGFAAIYYWIMREVVGIKEMSSTGADFFLIDRRVLEAFRGFQETNASIFSLITWMGYRQSSVEYDKQARLHGESGWSLDKKVKLLVDSVLSFSYLPIRLMSYVGGSVALLGFAYAGFVLFNASTGHPVEGWSSLMVVVLLAGAAQMLMMGVLGEYLWRALDESRRRPRYLVEDQTF